MKSILSSAVLIASFGAAHVAFAQQAGNSDAEYCRTLARTFLSQNPAQEATTVGDSTLLDSCGTDTARTTETLKQRFASHGMDLPKPSVAGASQ